MPKAVHINDILTQVDRLDNNARLLLMAHLTLLINKTKSPQKSQPISAISGFGSEVWSGIDIDAYVDRERQW